MNRILVLAIAASASNAAATNSAATPATATALKHSSSSLAAEEVATPGVPYYGATMMQALRASTPMIATAAADASSRHSKTAKDEKESEMQDTPSTAAAADIVMVEATTTHPISDESGNHTLLLHQQDHNSTPKNNAHRNHPQYGGDQSEAQWPKEETQRLGKSSKSKTLTGGKGGKTSKTNNDDEYYVVDQGTAAWSPGTTTSSSNPPSSSHASLQSSSPSSTPSFEPSALPSTTSSISLSMHPTKTNLNNNNTSNELPALTWMGVNGCTPTNPCDACSGDCDTDSDCRQPTILDDDINNNNDDNNNNNNNNNNANVHDNVVDMPVMEIISLLQQQQQQQRRRKKSMTMACYKRADGSTDQVPGCQVGGEGDIPGADYCYFKKQVVNDDNNNNNNNDNNNDNNNNDCDTGVPTYLPTAANNNGPTVAVAVTTNPVTIPPTTAISSSSEPPSAMKNSSMTPSSTINPSGTTTTLSPAQGITGPPSFDKTLWPSASGIVEERIEAYFIQSRATSNNSTGGGGGGDGTTTTTTTASSSSSSSEGISSVGIRMEEDDDVTLNSPRRRGRKNLVAGGSVSGSAVRNWCASGALSPNYYQLLVEECSYGNHHHGLQVSSGNNVIARMEQMDQLWSMDSEGYIHSVWDYERCMTVPIYAVDNVDEVPVKIGPCNHDDGSALSQFYYDNHTLKLVGYNRLCVTFEGGDVATKGSPMILGPCRENEDKFGWDFVLKQDQDEVLQQPSSAPITSSPVVASDLPRLQYLGRSGCGGESSAPCESCAGDCDVDDDCLSGLLCFQRAIGDISQVPGCASGGPGDIPGADYCFDPTFVEGDGGEERLPYLRWGGAEGCTAENPCPACKGDCDEDEDCQGQYKCLKRLVGETTQVPGCAVGGKGDIPGGDYCYDPGTSTDAESGITSGSSIPVNLPPSLSTQPTLLKPAESTNSLPSLGGHTPAPANSIAKAPTYPTLQSMPIPFPPMPSPDSVASKLQYLGRNACNTSSPCQSCAGDCDSNDDCLGELLCFQRAIGDSSQVPGCEVGGVGDIPGGDYCFNATYVDGNPVSSSATLVPTSSSAGATLLPPLRWLGNEGCTPDSPCLACVGDCDDDDDCNRPFMCFKRLLGEKTQVPGCAVGGLDDIPGGDYCYDPTQRIIPPPSVSENIKTGADQTFAPLTLTDFRGGDSTIKSETTMKNTHVPSSVSTTTSQLSLPKLGNPSLIPIPIIQDNMSGTQRTSSGEMIKKNLSSKNVNGQIDGSQMKGKHNGSGESSISAIERRRKHESTRKERQHLVANQKKNKKRTML